MNCLHCTADVTNGLALCDRCQNTLRAALVNVAAYYGDVDNIQPGQRVKVRSAYQSTPPPEVKPGADKISESLSHAAVIVIGWARNFADDRPQAAAMPTTLVRVCGWLESHVSSIATLEWAGECLRELMDVERQLRRILDKADTGQFAGPCGNEVGREEVDGETVPLTCQRGLYSTASSNWVRCPECGRTWNSKERREVMRRESEDRVAPVRVLARIAVGLTDEVSEERLIRRIEQWVRRDQLQSAGHRYLDGRLRQVYRIGDVLRLVNGDVKPKDAQAC